MNFPAKCALDRLAWGSQSISSRLSVLQRQNGIDQKDPTFAELHYANWSVSSGAKSFALFDKAAKAHPALSTEIFKIKAELHQAIVNRKAEAAAEKARLDRVRAGRTEKAKAVTPETNVPLRKVARETFDILSANLATDRASFVAKVVEGNLTIADTLRKDFAAANGDADKIKRVKNHPMFFEVFSREWVNGRCQYVVTDVEASNKGITTRATAEAKADFDSYVVKLGEKIGRPMTSVEYSGNLWNGSVLKVTFADGTTQVWDTRMILNFSVYGTPYNQWPTTLRH